MARFIQFRINSPGVVMYGMNWIEPAVGHVPKGMDGNPTDLVMNRAVQVRQTSARCDPQFKVPHYQAVGLEDVQCPGSH